MRWGKNASTSQDRCSDDSRAQLGLSQKFANLSLNNWKSTKHALLKSRLDSYSLQGIFLISPIKYLDFITLNDLIGCHALDKKAHLPHVNAYVVNY